MSKIVTVFVRRADLTREEFRRYYEERHVPLARPHFPEFGFHKTTRNHVVGPPGAAPGFDCLTEFHFESAAQIQRSAAFMVTPECRRVSEDELNFLDMSRHPSLEVRELILAGPPRSPDPPLARKTLLVLRRGTAKPADEFAASVERFARELADRHASEIHRLMLDLVAPSAGASPRFDAIVTLWPAPGARAAEALRWPDASDEARAVEVEASEWSAPVVAQRNPLR